MIERIFEINAGLRPGCRVRVTEQRPANTTDEGTVQIYQRPQHLGDASTTGRPPRKVVSMEQSKLALLFCALCV